MDSFIFLGLTIQGWLTVITIFGVFFVMARGRIPAEIVFLSATTILLVIGAINEAEAMAGFGSETVMVNAAFFVVMAGLMQSGFVFWLTQNILGTPSNYNNAMFRLMIPISILSALIGGGNVVSLFVDIVKMWTKRLKVAPSKLLLPLSYAASLGGMCTLIGNPSNLIIAGLYLNYTGKSLSMFEPLLPGLVLTIIGILMTIMLKRYIPERESPEQSFENTSDYTVELLVPTDNPAVAMTVEESGLNKVKGGSLVEIVRFDKEIIMPVPPDEYIMGGDRLIYAGQISEILELKQSHGLVAADHHVYSINEIDSNRKLRTAYVCFGSDLIGKCMTDSDFEHNNDVVLVAVARQGKRVDGQPREIRLEAGDTLLLECPPKADRLLEEGNRRRLTFFDSHVLPRTGKRTFTAALILILIYVSSSFNIMPLMTSTLVAAGAVLLFKCCRMDHVVRYLEWEVLIVLGATLSFAAAMTHTGVVNTIATSVLDICGNNPYLVMTIMCVLASVVSEFVSDMGSGAIFFPIVMQQAENMGCNPMPFVVALMISVTISYSSPVGSSTHMLVFGPGSFRFTDFARIGIWVHIVLQIACLVVVNLIYPLYP